MSQMPGSPSPNDDLQFNTVEPAVGTVAPATNAIACLACKQPLTDTYFAIGDKVICGNCCARITAPPPGNAATRYTMALVFGLGAAILGAVIWYAVVEITGWWIGYVAIGVGYIVGKAIRKGAGGRGGREFQVMAVILTYGAIAAYYAAKEVQFLLHEIPNLVWTQQIVREVAKDSISAPFRGGAQDILGILIIGLGLLQAWRITAYRKLPISGPFQVGPRTGQAAISGVQA